MDGLMISGERKLPQSELMANAARAAGGFHGLSVVEGDAVALMLRNDFAFFEGALGAALVGAYAVPINCTSPRTRPVTSSPIAALKYC